MTDPASLDNDYKLHDAYVAFSAEMVRLALLSPALFAFLLPLLNPEKNVLTLAGAVKPAGYLLPLGFVCMALAVLFGLAHRYFATDFLATRIQNLRNPERPPKETEFRLDAATWSIALSAVSLFLGAALLLLSVYLILFVDKAPSRPAAVALHETSLVIAPDTSAGTVVGNPLRCASGIFMS